MSELSQYDSLFSVLVKTFLYGTLGIFSFSCPDHQEAQYSFYCKYQSLMCSPSRTLILTGLTSSPMGIHGFIQVNLIKDQCQMGEIIAV